MSNHQEQQTHLSSLSDLKIDIPIDIYNHLQNQYKCLNTTSSYKKEEREVDNNNGGSHLDLILHAMKSSPQITTCRVNLCLASSVDDVLKDLNHFLATLNYDNNLKFQKWHEEEHDDGTVSKVAGAEYDHGLSRSKLCSQGGVLFQANKHDILPDVIEIRLASDLSTYSLDNYISLPKDIDSKDNELITTEGASESEAPGSGAATSSSKITWWPSRIKSKFPTQFKVIICDRKCGEAVLRGSNIFLRGIVAADKNVEKYDIVYVYAHLDYKKDSNGMIFPTIRRGVVIDHYLGHCVFLGIGQVTCTRAEMFNQTKGLGVEMLNGIFKQSQKGDDSSTQEKYYTTRAGPLSPPMNDILSSKIMLQNLPSILVAHILQPKPKEIIIDLCCAPGGKTSHCASLVKNDATIIACDKSRKKVNAAKEFFIKMDASCIIPLVLDTTKCVLDEDDSNNNSRRRSVEDIVSLAKPSDIDGLLDVKGFYPNSFDRIILDPPCSALGLRPKLSIEIKSLSDLNKFADYQQRFINSAVSLLKDGGTFVYSTCTINANENEMMVKYILDNFKFMKLVPISLSVASSFGLPGLPYCGLSDEERFMVRRFDPSDKADTMGFFIAKFVKRNTPT